MSIKTSMEVRDAAMAEVAGLLKSHWPKIKDSVRDAEALCEDGNLKKFDIGLGLTLNTQDKDNVSTTIATAHISYIRGIKIKDDSTGAFIDDHPKLPGMKESGKGEKPKK